ncbi:MAG: hypothetical protein M1821_008036 [Bathelium mastoideum]|nr:MAG: hypothetical protein M1821_008036 [Bathelium mastoideum]KAI9693081.1 MAG: hypothetical protein M1822_005076 [Bathelium mastoideum]
MDLRRAEQELERLLEEEFVRQSNTNQAGTPTMTGQPARPDPDRLRRLQFMQRRLQALQDRRVARAVAYEMRAPIPAGGQAADDAELATLCRRIGIVVEARAADANGNPSDDIESEEEECVACVTSIPLSDCAFLRCPHIYCRECLAHLFTTALKNEASFPPRCCGIEIRLPDVRHLLSDEVIQIFEEKAIEFRAPGAERVYCAKPECSAFIPPSRYKKREDALAQCPQCESTTCTRCKLIAHKGDCPKDSDIDEVLNLAKKKKWQRCPECGRLVELTDGCNHITCPCGADFCYRCGLKYDNCKCDSNLPWIHLGMMAGPEALDAVLPYQGHPGVLGLPAWANPRIRNFQRHEGRAGALNGGAQGDRMGRTRLRIGLPDGLGMGQHNPGTYPHANEGIPRNPGSGTPRDGLAENSGRARPTPQVPPGLLYHPSELPASVTGPFQGPPFPGVSGSSQQHSVSSESKPAGRGKRDHTGRFARPRAPASLFPEPNTRGAIPDRNTKTDNSRSFTRVIDANPRKRRNGGRSESGYGTASSSNFSPPQIEPANRSSGSTILPGYGYASGNQPGHHGGGQQVQTPISDTSTRRADTSRQTFDQNPHQTGLANHLPAAFGGGNPAQAQASSEYGNTSGNGAYSHFWGVPFGGQPTGQPDRVAYLANNSLAGYNPFASAQTQGSSPYGSPGFGLAGGYHHAWPGQQPAMPGDVPPHPAPSGPFAEPSLVSQRMHLNQQNSFGYRPSGQTFRDPNARPPSPSLFLHPAPPSNSHIHTPPGLDPVRSTADMTSVGAGGSNGAYAASGPFGGPAFDPSSLAPVGPQPEGDTDVVMGEPDGSFYDDLLNEIFSNREHSSHQ